MQRGEHSLSLRWQPVPGAQGFHLRWRPEGERCPGWGLGTNGGGAVGGVGEVGEVSGSG